MKLAINNLLIDIKGISFDVNENGERSHICVQGSEEEIVKIGGNPSYRGTNYIDGEEMTEAVYDTLGPFEVLDASLNWVRKFFVD